MRRRVGNGCSYGCGIDAANKACGVWGEGRVMDTFTFLVAMLLMMLALQYNQNWMLFAILVIAVITSRSVVTAIVMVLSAAMLYFLTKSGQIEGLWPAVIIGLIVVSLLLTSGKKPQQPEFYGPEAGYGGMFGGEGGGM